MKPVKLFVTIGFFGVVLTMTACMTWAAQDQQTQQRKSLPTLAELNAYKSAHNETDAQAKIKMLNELVIKYPDVANPDSGLTLDIYRDYYRTYALLGKYPETIAYVDTFLASGGDILPPAERGESLYVRSQAYFQGCRSSAFHSPDAYLKARDAAAQGLQVLQILGQGQKSQNLSEQMVTVYSQRFSSVLGIAESGLTDPKSDYCEAASAPDPGKFNRMVDQINSDEHQSSSAP